MKIIEIIDQTPNQERIQIYRETINRCLSLKNPQNTNDILHDQSIIKSCLKTYEATDESSLETDAVKIHCHQVLYELAHKLNDCKAALWHAHQAIDIIDSNKEITEPTAEIYNNLAVTEDIQKNHQKALEYSAKAIEIDPRNYTFYSDRASIQAKVEDYAAVIESCNEAEVVAALSKTEISAIHSESIKAHRGCAYMIRGESFLALRDYEALTREYPSKILYHRICVKLCAAIKDKHTAQIKDITENIQEDFSHN